MPDLCEDLLSSVDQPLKISKDKETGKEYLLCDYNRDGDSYRLVSLSVVFTASFVLINLVTVYQLFPSFFRSPWSNKYDPPLDDGALPSDRLRRLEIEANKVFDTYREL